MSIDPPMQVSVSDRFASEVRQLGKRYRRIRLDIQPIITQLESGELPGDQIPGMNYTLFKVRVRNSDVQKRTINNLEMATALQQDQNLDPGKSHAIVLALEQQADELLIDERRGRREASKLGLPINCTIPVRKRDRLLSTRHKIHHRRRTRSPEWIFDPTQNRLDY